jgi:SAM-dependent methyltransferase
MGKGTISSGIDLPYDQLEIEEGLVPSLSMSIANAQASRARTGAAGRLDEADLYRYGVRIGMHLAAAGRLNRGLRYLIRPIPYWRSLEYRLVWNEAAFERSDRVLDIGSPKLLSIYLAERVGAEVFATDIEDYFLNEYRFLRAARRLSPDQLHLEVEDGRKLSYPDDSFSRVYAISVVEHIPDGGDAQCLSEIGRVLQPGGVCLITVPFWPTSKDEYRAPNFYWAGSSRQATTGRVFFQRRYSEKDLYARLVKPSRLEVKEIVYVGERILRRSTRELSEFLIPPTGPLQPLLSRVVHTAPTHAWRQLKKPLCAFLVLKKP